MSAHDDYLDPDRHLPPEPPEWWNTMEQNCREILAEFGCKTWGERYRIAYKFTPCGPTIGVLCSGQESPAYNNELYQFKADSPVVEILVSSIVEGSDAETTVHRVCLKTPHAKERFASALTNVNAEVEAIIDEMKMFRHSSRKQKRKSKP